MYYIEVRHNGLGKYRHIRGKDKYVVEQKALAQRVQWDQMWERRVEIENGKRDRQNIARNHAENQQLAENLSKEAEEKVSEIQNILRHTLKIDDTICWESIKDKEKFPRKKPAALKKEEFRQAPSIDSFTPKLNLLEKLFRSLGDKKRQASLEAHNKALNEWHEDKKHFEFRLTREKTQHLQQIAEWEAEKAAYEERQLAQNNSIDELKKSYESLDPEAIEEYCDMVLSRSVYPENFPQQFEIQYIPANKTLIIEYTLPNIDTMPTLKSVNYVKSREDFKETFLSTAALNKLYDTALYEIALRTIHECFEADAVKALDAIVFNGWIHSISPATGQPLHACIMSVHTGKEAFMRINLASVEPKTCFKNLKGVAAAKLFETTPVAPVLKIEKTDGRFIEAYSVVNNIDTETNLALIDWQDFEHLIREIFEKEFSTNGSEVKVTQSSKDGGVDAVIFDPDVLRGGKIVIQAKRYSSTVGVSHVRDLYGTLLNEGANKGILITTSDFGPDAYTFSQDKPIVLLNGANLLHLLEKHGHRARIDLSEAKKNKISQIGS